MGVSQRQSNIELCRLVSILLVIIVHTTHQTLGTDVTFGVHLLAGFTLIGVNVFILITGYFSANPKRISIANLAFICLFWMIVRIGCKYCLHQGLDYKDLFFVTRSNWFIPCYIALLFFTPVLNAFCNSSSKRTLVGVVVSLLILELWFDWLPPNPVIKLGSHNGYSVLSFLILYLLARTIRLYGLPNWFKKISPLVYIVCSVLSALLIQMSVAGGHPWAVTMFRAYNSPIIILSSVAFLVMFERMKIQSKFINHIAKSTLACLLGQMAISSLYSRQFKFLYENYSGWKIIGFWLLAIVVVFVGSVLMDQLRLLLWKPINGWLITKLKKDNIF